MAFVPSDVGAWLRDLTEDPQMATIAAHLAACRDRGHTPATLGSKYGVLARAQRLTGGKLEEVTERAIRQWWRSQAGLAPSTRFAYLTHLRVFFRWVLREDIRDDDPTRRLDGPRVKAGMPKPSPEKAVRAMLTAVDGTPQWLPLALAVFCGLRVAEISRVMPDHVEIDADGKAMLRVRGKGGTEFVLPLVPELARRLQDLPAGAQAVRGRYGKGYTPQGLSDAIGRIMADHGVPGSAHSLRHLFGTRVHRQTRDLLATQRLMRHASPATTSGYAAMDVTLLRDAAGSVWDDLSTPTAAETEDDDTEGSTDQ